MTNVLILASNQAFGERLETFVREQLRCTVAGLTINATAALALMDATRPDVALVDVALPDESGFELTRLLIAVNPAVRVVLLGDDEPAEYLHAAAQAGALAYLPKTAVSQRLPVVLGISASASASTIRRLDKTTSPRGLVLQGVLAGGALMSGLALGQPSAALAGAFGVIVLLHWYSARGRRSLLLAVCAPAAATRAPPPSGRRPSRADGVRGSPERSVHPTETS